MPHFLNRRFVKHNFGVACISNWTIYSFLGGLKKSLSQSQYYFHFNTSRQALDTHKKNVGKKKTYPKFYPRFMCKLIGHIHPPFSLFAQKLHQFKRLLIDILDARIHRYLNSSHKKNRPIDLIDLIIGEVYCIYTQHTSRNCEKDIGLKLFMTPQGIC